MKSLKPSVNGMLGEIPDYFSSDEKYHMIIKDYAAILNDVVAQSYSLQSARSLINHPFNIADSLSRQEACHLLPAGERKQFRKYFPQGFDYASLDEATNALIEKDMLRNRFHREIIPFAQEHLSKDELDVHIDITAASSGDSLVYERSTQGFATRGKERGTYSALQTSGSKKKALLLGVLHIDYALTHTGENVWTFRPDNEGYNNLLVDGHPSIQTTARPQGIFEKFSEDSDVAKYHSVLKEQTKEDNNRTIQEISERYGDYVSFAGFAPFLFDHTRAYFHQVVEFDFEKIFEQEKMPEIYIENLFEDISSLFSKTEKIGN